jgi:NarL family two-component system sensor histidine kinase LiaS
MSHLLQRFRTLQWRLTLTYTLVTVLVVLVLQVVFWTIAGFTYVRSPGLPYDVVPSLEQLAPEAIPYLERAQSDRRGLDLWLRDTAANGRLNLTAGNLDFATPPEGTSRAYILDPSGHVVVATGAHVAAPGTALLPLLDAAGRRVVQAALRGETRPAEVTTPIAAGRAVLASPIEGNGRVLGVLVLDWDVDAARAHYGPGILLGLLPFVFTFTLGAGLIGLVAGFVTARGLSRRLRGIARAAAAWSRGDFEVSARDPSADELGWLAQDLNGMAMQLKALLTDREQLAIIEERQRLARELHDAVKQQVFATAMQVAAAQELVESDAGATRARLAEAERLIGQAQRELNALIRELRPFALGEQGLAAALQTLGTEWAQASGITADVRIQGERPTPPEIEQALFRVVQEALANAARHSAASAVEIHLAWGPDALSLSIQDNGRGFDPAHRQGTGQGLRNMAERVEALGGSLLVFGGAEGTRIEARVPLAGSELASAREKGAAR